MTLEVCKRDALARHDSIQDFLHHLVRPCAVASHFPQAENFAQTHYIVNIDSFWLYIASSCCKKPCCTIGIFNGIIPTNTLLGLCIGSGPSFMEEHTLVIAGWAMPMCYIDCCHTIILSSATLKLINKQTDTAAMVTSTSYSPSSSFSSSSSNSSVFTVAVSDLVLQKSNCDG